MICLISLNTFSDVLPAFLCAGATDNFETFVYELIIWHHLHKSISEQLLHNLINSYRDSLSVLIFLLYFFTLLICTFFLVFNLSLSFAFSIIICPSCVLESPFLVAVFYLWLFDFLIAHKKHTYTSQMFLPVPTTFSLKKYTHKSENILIISFHTNYSHKKTSHFIIIMRINIFCGH